MSKYCVIDEFFKQLDEMAAVVDQMPDDDTRAQLIIIHAHMSKVVRIGERAALELEAGRGRGKEKFKINISRSLLKREKDTYQLDIPKNPQYESKTNQ